MRLERRSSFGWGPSGAGHAACANGLVVHYDGSDQGLAGRSHSACRDYWQRTRRFHMISRGWADIGYSFGVCPHGIIMEGRGWQRQQAAQPGGNSTWTSVTFCSGEHERPTSAQVEAFRELRAWLRGKGLAAAVSYHGRFISTSCPGGILRRMVTSGELAGAPAAKPPAKPPAFKRILRQPPLMRGEDVETWQRRMRARGWRIEVDRWYGPASESVCRAFQKDKGLRVTGDVDRATWDAAWTAKIT